MRRIIRESIPLSDSIAANYLRARGIDQLEGIDALRCHPRLYYRLSKADNTSTAKNWPALIGIVTDLDGNSTGVHRTWIDPATQTKAKVADPRRSMGQLLGHAIRFGVPQEVMIVGEGIETLLSLAEIMPDMPMAAATSSAHLAAFLFPPLLRRLYIAQDNDHAGRLATANLAQRAPYPFRGKARAARPSSRAIWRAGVAGTNKGLRALFSAAGQARLCIAKQNSAVAALLRLTLRPSSRVDAGPLRLPVPVPPIRPV